jgi:hypothetical protein
MKGNLIGIMRYFRICFLALLTIYAFLLACSIKEKPKEVSLIEYMGWGFSVQLPKDTTVQKKTPIDFDIYSFNKYDNVSPFLKAYVGNHPNFPMIPSGSTNLEQIDINGLSAKSITWIDSKGLFGREILITLSQDVKDPNYIHYWYNENSQSDKLLADQVILSTTKKN